MVKKACFLPNTSGAVNPLSASLTLTRLQFVQESAVALSTRHLDKNKTVLHRTKSHLCSPLTLTILITVSGGHNFAYGLL